MNLSSNISALENEDYPFIANALALACDVSAKDVYVSQHLSLPEFLFTACAVVVALTATGTLWAIFKKMEACFIRRWNSVGQQEKVAPIVVEKRNVQLEGYEDSENDMVDAKEEAKENLDENVEGAFEIEAEELPFPVSEIEIPENEEKAEFVQMLMNVMHAGITIYLAINYWYVYLPDTTHQTLGRQIVCRAAHLTVMPLFKPVSIAMWPALMPLLQFVHWQANRKKPLDQYQDRVLPGTQPFAMNWISLIYAYLIGVCWITYMMATLVFLPLFLMSSWAIIPALWVMPFIFLHMPVQLLRGRAFCCRCCLCCWRKSDFKKLGTGGTDYITRLARYYKVDPEELERSIWSSEEYTENESVGLLTLKALTVLYMAAAVSSLYFLPVYSGKMDMYDQMLRALRLELDWQPSIEFAFHINFNFVFAWPTDLLITFQLPMFFSFTLVAFERIIAILWLVNDYMKRFEINETSYRYSIWMVYAPYWLGEKFYIMFEVGWECVVLGYVLIVGVCALCFACCYKCFARFDRFPFGKAQDNEKYEIIYEGLWVGLLSVTEKTGLYNILHRIINIEDTSHDLGGGISPNTIRMWVENNELKVLNLKRHHLGDAEISSLCTNLMAKNNIFETMNLDENSFSSTGGYIIADMIKAKASLKHLSLPNNAIRDDGAKAIALALRVNTTLRSIDLTSTGLGKEAGKALGKALLANASLKTVNLKLNVGLGDEGGAAIAEGLKQNTVLEHINFSRTKIGDTFGKALAEALKVNRSLRSIDLSYNMIGNVGAKAIGESLCASSPLQLMNVLGNAFHDEGFDAIKAGYYRCKHLKSVCGIIESAREVKENFPRQFGPVDGKLIALEIADNERIENLDLNSNHIGNEGIKAIAQALNGNSMLKSMNLNFCNITTDGASAIRQALETNRSLQTIDLGANQICDEGAKAIAEILKINTSLKHINLENCSICNDGANALLEALKVNTSLQSIELKHNYHINHKIKDLLRSINANDRGLVVTIN